VTNFLSIMVEAKGADDCLGGFSQGGAISLFTGITCPNKLAGIFGLSSYLLLHNKIKDYVTEESTNKDTPIFMGHGDADPLVK